MLVALATAEALHQASHIVVDLSALVPQSGNLFVAPLQTNQVAMIEIALHHTSSRPIACFDVRQEEAERYQPRMAR
jgi:hypothetical protein